MPRLSPPGFIGYTLHAMESREVEPPAPLESRLSRGAVAHTLTATFLGWTLDAFDFFVLVFALPAIAAEFHKSIADIAFTITATLAMRPLGAVLFGWLADRYGRRRPLMANIIFYSVIEVLSGLAPSYRTFLILRALYGIGMGGEWGVGAALAMEAVGPGSRGFFSGLLQEGYAVGYLLAAAAFFFVFPRFGWRPLFFIGGLPALLTIYIRSKVPESQAWERTRPTTRDVVRAIRSNLAPLGYLVVLMTVMNFVSHGTQDLYPTFLQKQRGLDTRTVAMIAVIFNVGALLGGLAFGYFSDRWGRRSAMASALALAAALIPFWIYSRSLGLLTAGAFLMQFMVQGAWGIVPAHLAELSPPQVRGLFSGLAYQSGVFFASFAAFGQAVLAESFGYASAMAGTAAVVTVTAMVVVLLGSERTAAELSATEHLH
ncbi:MAG TPA: MFS transporter [Candidatus Binataceae bacterium]|jgi:SHS family lactate transporter-like MFS transporter